MIVLMIFKLSTIKLYAYDNQYEALNYYQVSDIPQSVIDDCEAVGKIYGICPELLEAMAWNESGFRANVSNGRCIGILQVDKYLHSDRMTKLGVTDLYDQYSCILVAGDILSELFEKYDGEVLYAINNYAGYNNIYQDTKYSRKVLSISEELERYHGK